MSLQLRMMLLIGALFAIIYAAIVLIGTAMGMRDFYFYLMVSVGLMWIQFMAGPKIIEWTMRLQYIKREDNPKLWDMVQDLARRANMPLPRVCISPSPLPNAFAFGRGINDGRVCVCRGILNLLDEDELRAVLGHELAHIKNRDMVTITLLSVVPMIMYRVAWHFMWYGGGRRNDRNAPSGAVIGLAAFLFYFITNLLVLYGSRIREYYADKGSVEMGNKPSALASALYKLVYGSARMADTEEMKQVEGMKAFFPNDPSRALNEIRDLKQLDTDHSGTIDNSELLRLRNKQLVLGTGEKLMELLSTHPNMLKRIKHLSELK
ncbi:MAG: M48 family metalloprotease [Candidatus Omnitrophica bacterium]|nr:M48 family metalloprotease [Candidatus Omnitrophota bacterium]